MKATCCADDLPKLKPFPWERIFPPNTPADAVDLAQRLLRYDPDQRLTASQALAHPFFDGASELVEGAGGEQRVSLTPAKPTLSVEEWEGRLKRELAEMGTDAGPLRNAEEKIAKRLSDELGSSPLSAAGVGKVMAIVKEELNGGLQVLDGRACELLKRVRQDVQTMQLCLPLDGSAGPAPATPAVDLSKLQAELKELKELKRAAQAAIDERDRVAASVRAAQLSADLSVRPPGTADSDRSSYQAAQPTPIPGFGRRAPQASRQSTVDGVPVSPMYGDGKPLSVLTTDNLGQMTPAGAYSPGSGEHSPSNAARGATVARRRSKLAEGETEEGRQEGAAS